MNTKEILFQKALTDQMKGAAEFLQIDLSRIVHQIEKNGALPYVQHLLHRGLESPAFLDLAKMIDCLCLLKLLSFARNLENCFLTKK